MSKNKKQLKFGLISIEAVIIFAIVLALGIGGFFMSRANVIHTQQKGGYTLSDKDHTLITEDGSSTNIVQDLILTPEILRIQVGQKASVTATVIPQNLWTARLRWLPMEGGQRISTIASSDTLSAEVTGVKRGLASIKVMSDDGGQNYKTVTVYVGTEAEFSQNFTVQSISTSETLEAIVSSNIPWDSNSLTISWKINSGAGFITLQPNGNKAKITPTGEIGEAVIYATVLDKDFDRTYNFSFTVRIRNAWSLYSDYFEFSEAFKQRYNSDLTNGTLECNESTATREVWGNWSDWTDVDPGSNTATREVSVATVYRTRTYGAWSTCNSSSTWSDAKGVENNTRKYIERTVYQNWGDWSTWSTTNPGTATATMKVENKTQYCQKTRPANAWSAWQTTAITSTADLEVETATVYRYRDVNTTWTTTQGDVYTSKTQYCKQTRTAGEWSDWTTTKPIEPNGGAELKTETTTGYSYREASDWTTTKGTDVYLSKPQYSLNPVVNRAIKYSYYLQSLTVSSSINTGAVHQSSSNGYNSSNEESCETYGCAYFDHVGTKTFSDLGIADVYDATWTTVGNSAGFTSVCIIDFGTNCSGWTNPTSGSSFALDGKPQFIYASSANEAGAITGFRVTWTKASTASGSILVIDKDTNQPNVGGVWMGSGLTGQAYGGGLFANNSNSLFEGKTTFVDDAAKAIYLKQIKDSTPSTVPANTYYVHYVTAADMGTYNWTDTQPASDRAYVTREVYRNWSSWSSYSTTQPTKPSFTTAHNASGQPRLLWSAVPNATKYNVYRATSYDGTYSSVFETTGTSYTHTSATAGTTYYYKLMVTYSDGTTYTSNPVWTSMNATEEMKSDFEIRTTTMYRSKLYSAWSTCNSSSTWQDTAYATSETVKNATRTVYQNWGSWSAWSTTKATETATKQVQQATGYRSRTFGEWGSCSATWSDTPYTEDYTSTNGTRNVYRSKKVNLTWTTEKGSEVYAEKPQYCLSTRTATSWSAWTTTPDTSSDSKDVESTTGYRYRNAEFEEYPTASCQKRLDTALINEISNAATIAVADGNLFGDSTWELPGYLKGQKMRIVYNATPANTSTKLCIKLWNDRETWSREVCSEAGKAGLVDNSFVLTTDIDVYPSFTYSTNVTTNANAGEVVGDISQKLSQLKMNSASSNMIIKYSLLQDGVWTGYGQNGDLVGTVGKGTSGIKMVLDGEVSSYYDIEYKVYDQTTGWTDWATNGEVITATNITALKAKLVKKIDADTRIYAQIVNRHLDTSNAGAGGTVQDLKIALNNE